MSRRSERRNRALQRSEKYRSDRIRAAQKKFGLPEDRVPLPSDAIAPRPDTTDDLNGVPDHDPAEIGRSPGELPAASPFEGDSPTRFRVICYDEKTHTMEEFADVDKLTRYVDKPGLTWIQMMGLTDPEIVHMVGAIFSVPMLAQEDLLAVWSRANFDEYGDMILSIARAVRLRLEDNEEVEQQISVIAGKNFVISFHENDTPVFKAIEHRIAANSGSIRKRGTGYLFYALFDTLVDRMLYLTEEIEDAIGDLEDGTLTEMSDLDIEKVYHLKSIVVRLSRTSSPLRETVRQMRRTEHPLLADSLALYFDDLNDHVLRTVDRGEHARMILQDLQEYHHTIQARKTNDVIRVLTVLSFIFMPLTFVAGVYGMNFKNMPEIEDTEYGYPVVIALMGLFILCSVIYFRRKKWI